MAPLDCVVVVDVAPELTVVVLVLVDPVVVLPSITAAPVVPVTEHLLVSQTMLVTKHEALIQTLPLPSCWQLNPDGQSVLVLHALRHCGPAAGGV